MTKFYAILLGIILISCNHKEKAVNSFQKIQGEAQGTTYSIVLDSAGVGLITKPVIDSIFTRIDSSLSVWKPQSVISTFNRSDQITVNDSHFLNMYYRSLELKELTEGSFNAQISPLVRAWGFGKDKHLPRAELNPDSLMFLVSTELTTEVDSVDDAIHFTKLPGQSLDVNGIAQGYTVDVLADFLEKRGSVNFMVEVGGEVATRGLNEQGEYWKIGIDKPIEDLSQRELEAVAELSNRALATSGSYRKFYELNGKKYSHTIDPKTGYPVQHNLLSASVMASNCTNADAFATAFMVMGTEKSKKFIESHPELQLDLFLIFSEADGSLNTYSTNGFSFVEE